MKKKPDKAFYTHEAIRFLKYTLPLWVRQADLLSSSDSDHTVSLTPRKKPLCLIP